MPKVGFRPDNINKFLKVFPDASLKEVLLRFAENPYVEKSLERTPITDMITICKQYEENPDLYDDVFNGKVKYFLNGLQDEPLPIFDNTKSVGNIKELLSPDAMLGKLTKIFDAFDFKKEEIKKVSLQIKNDALYSASFDSKNNVIATFTLPINDGKGILFKMLNAATDKRLDIIRD